MSGRGWCRRLGGLIGVAAVAAVMVSCTGFSNEVRTGQPTEEEQQQARDAAMRLYDSMVAVFQRDTEGIYSESRRAMRVVSHYESVDEERRRRFVGRIVPAGGGIGVNITAEYQKDEAVGGEKPDWEEQPREVVEREAQPDELALARSIERMYHGGGP